MAILPFARRANGLKPKFAATRRRVTNNSPYPVILRGFAILPPLLSFCASVSVVPNA